MKVRISIPGAYMVKDMPEDKAWETFGKLAEMILIISRKDKEEEGGAGLDTTSSDADPQVSVRVPGMEIHETEGGADEAAMDTPESRAGQKYKGFMYIRCPECGKEKGFFTRQETDHYHCDACGARRIFEKPVKELRLECECGTRLRYFTNLEEPLFDINCFRCGSPVTVSWNGKKKMYMTV